MRIGAHVSTAGGISKAVDRGVEIGCETIQIFGSSPQSWAFKSVPEAEASAFKRKAAETGLGPVFIHAIYLINLGTSNQANLEKGKQSLINYLTLAAQIGAGGVVFHPGSHQGVGYDGVVPQVVATLKEVLEKSPEGPCLAVENMAGMGQHIGASFDELGRILREVDNPRLRVCLDTQHSFAAGYDLTTPEGVASMIAEFDRAIGLGKLAAVHANDSKQPLGSGVDRHDNIGEGFIGKKGFAAIMAHSAFQAVPFFLEVPGFEGKGPDQRNVEILKEIRQKVGAPA
ncbi:MAG: deoxyribonuclease IV [SAR202 cluster bacterium]|nr:deoxyribonuclease IV [SAR202 cluster bacterium]